MRTVRPSALAFIGVLGFARWASGAGALTPSGSAAAARSEHTATVVGTGKVLILGGGASLGGTAAEFYSTGDVFDASAGMFTSAPGFSGTDIPCWFATARLPDGRGVVIGGQRLTLGSGMTTTNAVAAFDPKTNTWSPLAPLATARANHFAVVLADGRILVGGGESAASPPVALASVEIYDPPSATWTTAAPMKTARSFAGATLLSDGRVLVAGGEPLGGTPTPIAAAEVFDPKSGTWSPAGTLLLARTRAAVVTIGDRALIAGGNALDKMGALPETSSAEVFDPKSSTWTAAAPMRVARTGFSAAGLPSGRALVAGSTVATATPPAIETHTLVELYDPVLNAWLLVGPSAVPRTGASVTSLGDGRAVLIGGGERIYGASSALAEIFEQRATGAACTAAAQCVGNACVDGKCADTCTNDASCTEGSYCLSGKCLAAKTNGSTCDNARQCASALCIDGGCCSESRSCAPYRCGVTGCKVSCTSNVDCAPGATCSGGNCVGGSGSTCTDDKKISVGKDGKPASCAPYLCDDGTGQCRTVCTSTADCIAGFECSSTRICEVPSKSSDDGGCAVGAAPRGWSVAPLGLVLLGLLRAIRTTLDRAKRRDRAS